MDILPGERASGIVLTESIGILDEYMKKGERQGLFLCVFLFGGGDGTFFVFLELSFPGGSFLMVDRGFIRGRRE